MAEKTKPATKTTTKTTKAKTAKVKTEISSVNLNFIAFTEVIIMILALDYYIVDKTSFFLFSLFYLALFFFGDLVIKDLKKDMIFNLFSLTAWGLCLIIFAVASGIAKSSLWSADFMLWTYIIVGAVCIIAALVIMYMRNMDFNILIKNGLPIVLIPIIVGILETRFILLYSGSLTAFLQALLP